MYYVLSGVQPAVIWRISESLHDMLHFLKSKKNKLLSAS